VDYRHSRSTLCIVSPLFEVCVSSVTCVTVRLTVALAEMSSSSDECVSEADSNISSL